jgi:hypothetical protein
MEDGLERDRLFCTLYSLLYIRFDKTRKCYNSCSANHHHDAYSQEFNGQP